MPALPRVWTDRTGGMTVASGSGRTEASMEGVRLAGLLQPSRGLRACHVGPGSIRPPRGAARGLEANGRWFRTAKSPREDRRRSRFRQGNRMRGGDDHLQIRVPVPLDCLKSIASENRFLVAESRAASRSTRPASQSEPTQVSPPYSESLECQKKMYYFLTHESHSHISSGSDHAARPRWRAWWRLHAS